MLWRHGQTTWNAANRFQGQTDIPLSEVGLEQARRAARLLAALKPDRIVASDLSRAASTAEALARLTGLPVSLDKDLRERGGGCWEGLTREEIRERYPAEHATWEPPDGEDRSAVAERVSGALTRIAGELGPDELAVVASHGAAIRMGLERFLGLDACHPGTTGHAGVLGPLTNCSWSVLGSGHRGWRLLEHNAGNLPAGVRPVAESATVPDAPSPLSSGGTTPRTPRAPALGDDANT